MIIVVRKSMEVQALLIEDNPGDAMVIENTLKTHDDLKVGLSTVPTLADGLNYLRSDIGAGIDLILVDLHLPDSNGSETVSLLYREAKDRPILVITEEDSKDVIADCIRKGAYTFLVKNTLNGNLRLAIVAAQTRREIIQEHNARVLAELKKAFTL